MSSSLEPDTLIAERFRIVRELGHGGMGVVLEARDIKLKRSVAIKLMTDRAASKPAFVKRFLREAQTAAALKSEHTVRIYDFAQLEGNGSPYIVMELLTGRDLDHVIAHDGPLRVERAASLVIQACDALAEAHAARVVHRDLKPANLFLAEPRKGREVVKVLDFGIAKVVLDETGNETGDASKLTGGNQILGTPLYMSPEQRRGSSDVDLRTDIWALGVILYQLLTGQLPFDASSRSDLELKVLLEEPPDPCDLRDQLPRALADVVLCCLEKRPEDRFGDVADLAAHLAPHAPQDRALCESIAAQLNKTLLVVEAGDLKLPRRGAGSTGAAAVTETGSGEERALSLGVSLDSSAADNDEGASDHEVSGETELLGEPSRRRAPASTSPQAQTQLTGDGTAAPVHAETSGRGRLALAVLGVLGVGVVVAGAAGLGGNGFGNDAVETAGAEPAQLTPFAQRVRVHAGPQKLNCPELPKGAEVLVDTGKATVSQALKDCEASFELPGTLRGQRVPLLVRAQGFSANVAVEGVVVAGETLYIELTPAVPSTQVAPAASASADAMAPEEGSPKPAAAQPKRMPGPKVSPKQPASTATPKRECRDHIGNPCDCNICG